MRHLFATLLAITTCMIASALPTAVKNRTFFEGITYSWPYNADPSAQQQSNLGEIATDPDQIIAMLREVYSNPAIPGNYARGYSALNTPEGTWANGTATGNYPVAYPAVGTIVENNGICSYNNAYGWGVYGNAVTLPGWDVSESVSFVAGTDKSSTSRMSKGDFHIRFVNNLNISYYLLSYGYDQRFATTRGYQMTSVNFTFTEAGYGSSNIEYVKYRDDDGNIVRIDRSTTPKITDFMPAGGLRFEWTIPTDTLLIRTYSNQNVRASKIEATYKRLKTAYFERDTYLPNEEGNTLLLLEVKDGMTIDNLISSGLATKNSNNKFEDYNATDYASLRALVAATIKSARVLSESKRVGSGLNSGTLFKIDADKLNRFYIIGKGQLRWFNNDYSANSVNATELPRAENRYTTNQPYSLNNRYYDQSVEALFGHMFEQFSPSQATGGTALNDVYRLLVNGESFGVVHDCIDVISAEGTGHEFNMYGKESLSDDCQDVRDMMFFVPDYRMLTFTTGNKRDPNKAQKFLYYNPAHAPTMGLYVIKLDQITDAKRVKVEGEDAYDIDLTWTSNLLDFLPGEQGVYTIYRVTNIDGTETYTPITTITASTSANLTFTDRVAQLPNEGQTITYVVRGQDSEQFLNLQMSNKESVYIPGIDVSEDLNLKLQADFYSRFDPQTVCNNYSNLVTMGNIVSNITTSDLTSGSLTFTRSYKDENGENHTDVIATGTAKGTTLTVKMQNQSYFTYGYHKNGTGNVNANNPNSSFTVTFSSNSGGGVKFSKNVTFYDNFTVSVAENTHPNEYVYQVTFNFGDNERYARSNTMSVYVHKTAMDMEPEDGRAVSRDDIDGDVTRSLPANGTVDFDIDVKYSSKKEILRYDAYRWPEGATRYIIEPTSPTTAEQDVPPTGIAGNQGDRYTVAMNADNFLYTGETTTLGDEQTATQAHFVDNYVRDAAGIYTYAPVIEVFPPNESRTDYNTYGAPLQQAATGTVAVSERTSYTQTDNSQDIYPQKSGYTWQDADGTLCAYYTFLLNLDADIPEGYELYKVRAWRQMDTEFQYEELADRNFRKGSDVLFAEYTFPDYTKDSNTYWPIGAGDPMQSVSNQGGKVVGEMAGTFGAIDVTKANGGQGIDIPITFVVRAYYTREANMADLNTISGNAPRRLDAVNEADGKYYVLEKTIETTLKGTEGDNQIVTALTDAVADVREVAGVTYYNMTGAASKRPFYGVNIKVTRYTDGSTMTKKVIIK